MLPPSRCSLIIQLLDTEYIQEEKQTNQTNQPTYSMEQSPYWEANKSQNSMHFMEPKGSLQHS
jgi:hypothetical protein